MQKSEQLAQWRVDDEDVLDPGAFVFSKLRKEFMVAVIGGYDFDDSHRRDGWNRFLGFDKKQSESGNAERASPRRCRSNGGFTSLRTRSFS